MKKLSIILISALVAFAACTKSKEVHPEIGDGNDEIMTVGMKDVHVEYTRTDHAELQKVLFHYSLAEAQQFAVAEMTKQETIFELTLTDLLSDTLYYYYYELFPRGGDAFLSEQKTFHTQAYDTPEPPTPPSGAPEGAINGLFTINENGDQVYFSKGNLQYIGSANTSYWKFADNQWDNFGSATGQGSDNENVDRDLFGWGTSGYNHGAICYQPWSTSTNNSDYYAYGDASYHLYNQNGQADWGYNPISNGGNQSNQWRTLKREEWKYIVNNRVTPSGVNYAKAKLNNVNGILLLPDNWNVNSFTLSNTNSGLASFNDNVITSSQWNTLEQYGVVFLPAAGYRSGTSIISEGGTNGNYRSSTYGGVGDASYFTFDNTYVYPQHEDSRHYGFSVRLVCNNSSQPPITVPTIVTSYVSNVTSNTAQCGGEVTNDGGAEVTERGICWGTNENPTINDNHIAAGIGTGAFTAMMESLEANTNYHVRAYATNVAGTAYGMDREFVTGGGGSGVPEGAIDGLFSVSPGHKVYFSQGNLQYQASTNIWRFAEHQYTCVGSDNSNISQTYSGWIDLFAWATSGWNNGNLFYHPYDIGYVEDFEVGYGYGPTDGTNYNYDLTGIFANADWGVYNAISNGGNMPNLWRTLTVDEWDYILNYRATASGIRYAKGSVNGMNGVLLLPDAWSSSVHTLNNTNNNNASFTTNVIALSDWAIMEANGAVFLPAAGSRNYTTINLVGVEGPYWSVSHIIDGEGATYNMNFSDVFLVPNAYASRQAGISVRLVCPAE